MLQGDVARIDFTLHSIDVFSNNYNHKRTVHILVVTDTTYDFLR